MTTRIVSILVTWFVLSLAAPMQAQEWLVFGGPIHTLENEEPSDVQALAIRDGEILVAGSLAAARAALGPKAREIDLDGRSAIPGLVDAHAHLLGLGELLAQVSLRETSSADACVERALEMEAQLPEGEWLFGRGWDQNDWQESSFPTRAVLDVAFPDRPVVFERVDGHALWVNSVTLALAGITRHTKDPQGGEIIRDAAGEPTGVLVDTADSFVLAVQPEPSEEEVERRYRLAIADATRHGLTGIHDMGISVQNLGILRRGEREGWLDLRVVSYLAGDPALQAYEGGPDIPAPERRLRLVGVKLYTDGALGSRGAALLEDYSDRPGHRGLLIETPELLQQHIENAMTRGFGVAVHAIGDRGNRVTLDCIVAARDALAKEGVPIGPLHPRVEHAQIVHPDDLPRFVREGILPSMQPTHCTSDMPWAPVRLGEDRLVGAYAWRTLRDLGCILPLGSDFPVEEVSPWLGLYAARTRQKPDGTPIGGWSPEQRLTALESLLGFTVWAAQAIDEPAWGTLAAGSRADLVVIDRDPLSDDAAALLSSQVLLTMVDGEVVFAHGDYSATGR